MARVNTFLTVTPTIDDSILGTDNTSPGSNSITRNFTLTDIYGLFAPLTLADIVTQSIASGNITKAPSSDAVYNALFLKQRTITVTGNGSINQSTGVLNISTPSLQQVTTVGSTTTTSLTANSFIKTGGSAAQILAANGTIITAGDNLILSAQGVLNATGGATVTGTQNLQSVTNYGASTTAIITAAKFVTTGGASTSFVKGNGLLDNTVYAIASDVSSALALKANLTGATFTGNIASTGFVKTGNAPGEILMSDGSIVVQGTGITIASGIISSSGGSGSQTLDQVLIAGSTGARPMFLTVDGDTALTITTTSELDDLYNGLTLTSTGVGISTKSTNDVSLVANMVVDTVSGIEILSSLTATGFPLRIKKNNVTKLSINQDGELTATKLIKEGGDGTRVLLDNGSTTLLSSLGGGQNLQSVTTGTGANLTTNRILINATTVSGALFATNDGSGYGVYGQSENGEGVFGYSFHKAAVSGYAESSTGIGVRGYAEEGVGGEFETDATDINVNIVNFKRSGVLKAFISGGGELTASKLIKAGGGGLNVLLDNGNTAPLSSLGGNQSLGQVIGVNSVSSKGFTIDNAGQDSYIGINIVLTNDGETTPQGIVVQDPASISGNLGYAYEYIKSAGRVFSVNTLGQVYAQKFTIGGTSSQYLMADGSVSTGGSGSSGFEQNFLLMGA